MKKSGRQFRSFFITLQFCCLLFCIFAHMKRNVLVLVCLLGLTLLAKGMSSAMIIIFILIFTSILFVVLKIWKSSPRNIGKLGEKRVAQKLNRLPKDYITLNDILLPTNYDSTTQIDHIVVSPYGIFVIETKNYKGWIFGHENSEEWKQSLLGTKRFGRWSSKQHKFRNPILQNAAHARAVKAILKEVGDFAIIPIVVFSDSAELRISTHNHIVINWHNLRSVIKSYRTPCISPEDIQRIVSKISSANITTEGSRERHIRNIQTIQQSIENGKCPKCGGNLVVRKGRYGSFWGCSNYPKCRFTHNFRK